MTLEQMKSLEGASLLHLTADRLLSRCGLPGFIVDKAGPADTKRSVSRRGARMRLSTADWKIHYGGTAPRGAGKPEGWFNASTSRSRCLSGAVRLAFDAKGQIGVVSVTKRPDGVGYDTVYRVSDDPFRSHKITAVKVELRSGFPAATLVRLHGPPDEIVATPGGREHHRYWVLAHVHQRPDSLHAVDFEIASGDRTCRAYRISAAGIDWVDERMESLLRQWERDHVLD